MVSGNMKKQIKGKKYVKPIVRKESVKLNRFIKKSSFLIDDTMFLAACRGYATCLLPGVLISLASKSTVTVERLKVGDMVVSYDTLLREFSESEVVSILSKYRDSYYILNNSLKLSEDHPLWVNGSQWKKVEHIVIGDMLYTQENKLIKVVSKKFVKKRSVVFNIQLAGENKSYFANGFLTHTYLFVGGVYTLGPTYRFSSKSFSLSARG